LLIGDPEAIKKQAEKLNLKLDWGKIKIIDAHDQKLLGRYTGEFYALRKDKGMTEEEAAKLMKDYNYIGVMAVHLKEAGRHDFRRGGHNRHDGTARNTDYPNQGKVPQSIGTVFHDF